MRAVLLAGVAGLFLAVPAQAVTVTKSYTVTALFSQGPIDRVLSFLNVTFDPAARGFIRVNSFSSSLGSTYQPNVKALIDSRNIYFGNDCEGLGCSATTRLDQFYGSFQVDAAGAPDGGFPDFTYTSAANGAGYSPDVVAIRAAVPEPASWAMMALGMGAIGFAARRRRTGIAARA